MDKIFFRNYLIFAVALIAMSATLWYVFTAGDKSLQKTDASVTHTHRVIAEAQQLIAFVEGMQSSQRGYLITGDQIFVDRYEAKRAKADANLKKLQELTRDNPAQQERLAKIAQSYSAYKKMLEDRAHKLQALAARKELKVVNKEWLKGVEVIDGYKHAISQDNDTLLREEYRLLNERMALVEKKKDLYLKSLTTALFVGTALLLLFNAFILNMQTGRLRIEKALQETENRFILALEGTQDGVFDWDIVKGSVYFSKRYWAILGINRPGYSGTTQDFTERLHPEDSDRVWNYVDTYLKGRLSEYSIEFRMKHDSGRWIWINSRAKGIFDSSGKPLRLVGAHSDISHMKAAQEKLEIEKKRAEEVSQAKSDFMAHMSHEIRTPLTVISGVAEILSKRQTNLDDKQKQLVKTLHTSSASLKELVNDILDFSKIESGELELVQENFLLDVLFEEIVSMMSLRALEKGIGFVFDYAAVRDCEFYGDKMRLRQVLVNLIGNAIKFTEKGGVTVRARFDLKDGAEILVIDVADTGIGISPENKELVFERFKQADSSVSRRYGGTGLGLSISRNLAHMMGGEIALESEQGIGSTFTLVLPALNSLRKGVVRNDTELSAKLNDRIKMVARNESKVLLVEDYEGNIVVISYLLDDLGLIHDIARTGAQALELWKNNHYDVILMDVQMPEMDGFTATREIRAIESAESLERTPIIGMTAHALVGDKDKCIDSGMDAYLPKPIVESDLKKEILHYLGTHKKNVA